MNLKSVLLFLLGIFAVMGLAVALLWQFGNQSGKALVGVEGNKTNVIGSGSVVIVEFSDFQCPACANVQEPLKELLKKYDGQVSFVYRNFPLTNIHPFAVAAAQASEAAGQQGKFFAMHDILFARQGEWNNDRARDIFIGYAKEIGLDQEKFVADMDSQVVANIIREDSLAATRFRIAGTPTFFVNGVETPFEDIEAKIIELR